MFLTFFIMAPVWQDVNNNSLQPYLNKQISQQQAMDRAAVPLKKFMSRYTREKDLALFVKVSGIARPKTINDVPLWVLIPAYVISELKTAFLIGFVIYIPFLVVDMVVSAVLMAMGMMMLPPTGNDYLHSDSRSGVNCRACCGVSGVGVSGGYANSGDDAGNDSQND
ncbi:hypothetical protein CHS0354_026821 [Potamilus streckersoni]|uniref:Flagellar biosynthetic protein FliP n=1 Tax=Potamilus streckersoni TaxID=2493646 RepID=A0AAE0W8E3_9BIVA|nr:hypothetical protein CHS0354_026821 [Potamilus streckersoni]